MSTVELPFSDSELILKWCCGVFIESSGPNGQLIKKRSLELTLPSWQRQAVRSKGDKEFPTVPTLPRENAQDRLPLASRRFETSKHRNFKGGRNVKM